MKDKEPDSIHEEDQPAGKPRGLILPLFLALVAAGAGAFLGLTVLGPGVGPVLAARAVHGPSGSRGTGHGGGHGEDTGSLHVLENLVVNPAGSEGTRYLLVSVAIEPVDKGMVAQLSSMDVSLRHTLLTTLGGKTVRDLSDISKRPQIVAELERSLEGIVGQGLIKRIYLPQYVIQ